MLFNSIEGLTSLWDPQSGEVVGKHESYVRSGTDPAEPCEYRMCTSYSALPSCFRSKMDIQLRTWLMHNDLDCQQHGMSL